MIPQSFIDDLLQRVDIVTVIERYVPLKKAGQNYAACCPFHSEKSPSFTVSPTKQFYHCFGCGAHGTAIRFLMEHAGLDFVEAIHQLADDLGLNVPEDGGAPVQRPSTDLLVAMDTAARHYKGKLKDDPRAVEYLKQRGLTGATAASFHLGYAPDNWQSLNEVFPKYDANNLVEAGLVLVGENGRRYDRFRDRIMFPIHNERGQIVGFGGRVLGDGQPKYLNSPETPLFEKGKELYGLFQARDTIRQKKQVLVVEGYMDVVMLAQHGIGYAVATLGTATTPTHIQKLLRHSSRITFAFDGDNAGRKAAWRALENSLELLRDDRELSFLFFPENEDPDSFVRQHGQSAFEALLENALPLSEFLVKELISQVDLQTDEGRAHLIHLAKPLLAKLAAPTLKQLLRQRIAGLAGIAVSRPRTTQPAATPQRPRPRKAVSGLSSWLLERLVHFPELIQRGEFVLPDSLANSALAAVVDFLVTHPNIQNSAQIAEHFRSTPHEPIIEQALTSGTLWQDLPIAEREAEWDEAIARFTQKVRRSMFKTLKEKAEIEGLTALTPDERQQYLAMLRAR